MGSGIKSLFSYGAAAGVVLATLIGYNFIYVPQQKQAHLIHAQVAQEEANQRTASEVAVVLREVEQYRQRLHNEADPSWLAREVVDLAEKAGVQLTTITQETPQKLEQFTRLSISVQFNGSYHELGAFLDLLERSNHFVQVDHLLLSRPGTQTQASIQLVLSTLYLPPLMGEPAKCSPTL